MKKTYLLLLALSFCVLDGIFAQTEQKDYYPLIPETGEKQWDVKVVYLWNAVEYQVIRLAEEIELDGMMYRKMTYEDDGIYHSTGLEGAVREEGKKVYIRWWQPGLQYFMEEKVYYDFNLQVGDWFSVGDDEEPWYIQLMAIEEVVLEDGSTRNKFVFNEGWEEDPEVWIEGIGSLAGVHRRYTPGLMSSSFSYLQCYFEDDDLIWTDGECWDGIKEDVSENVSLHPNPTQGLLYVEAENLQKAEVLNLLGQVVQCQEGSAIDLFGLSAGVYVVRITDREGHVEVRKVVKE